MEYGLPLPHLRAWRRYHGLSQAELAQRAHMRRATLSDLETGKERASFAVIARLAEALGMTRETLIHTQPEDRD